MLRILMLLLALGVGGALDAAPAAAQYGPISTPAVKPPRAPGDWPAWVGDFDRHSFTRGPGGYLSLAPLALIVVVLLGWTASSDWVNRDAQELKLDYRRWNLVTWGPFTLLFLAMFVIPWVYLSLALLAVVWLLPLYLYGARRNKEVDESDRVFTTDHLRRKLADALAPLGIKIRSTPKKSKIVAPVTLVALGAKDAGEDQKRMIAARQSPGHDAAKSLLFRALHNRSTALMIDYSAEAAVVRFQIDSLWIDGEKQPRNVADPLLACLKLLCGLRVEDRRSRQQGTFRAVDDGENRKVLCKFSSQGTKTGERVVVQFDDPELRKRKIADLGLRKKTQDDLLGVLTAKQGLVVVAAPPGNGLTTLVSSCLSAIDRFTRSVMAVEDAQSKDLLVENVPVTSFDSLEQESPMTKLPAVLRQFPDVLVVPELMNAETLTLLCDEAVGEDRLVVTTVRAREAAEALLRPLTTKAPIKKYATAVSGVIVQRLIRKLCDQCREAYPPPPQILQKLGIPADKVQAFYRPPTQPRQEVCAKCAGLGYHGVTGIHEMLVVNDLVRQQLLREPSLEAVRAIVRKSGMKTFEDEGLLLVVKGTTSVQELARVLKDGAPAPA